MAERNQFDGGLSLRVDPQYVQPNQGVVAHNINFDKGSLQSRNKDELTGFSYRGTRPFWWRDKLFTNSEDAIFVEYDRRIFKNTNGLVYVSPYWEEAVDPIQWSLVGTEPPTGKLTLTHVLWEGLVVEVESTTAYLVVPRETDEFMMIKDGDVNMYHRHQYSYHSGNFYVEFYVPDDGLYQLYVNMGLNNYVLVGSASSGGSIIFAASETIGEELTVLTARNTRVAADTDTYMDGAPQLLYFGEYDVKGSYPTTTYNLGKLLTEDGVVLLPRILSFEYKTIKDLDTGAFIERGILRLQIDSILEDGSFVNGPQSDIFVDMDMFDDYFVLVGYFSSLVTSDNSEGYSLHLNIVSTTQTTYQQQFITVTIDSKFKALGHRAVILTSDYVQYPTKVKNIGEFTLIFTRYDNGKLRENVMYVVPNDPSVNVQYFEDFMQVLKPSEDLGYYAQDNEIVNDYWFVLDESGDKLYGLISGLNKARLYVRLFNGGDWVLVDEFEGLYTNIGYANNVANGFLYLPFRETVVMYDYINDSVVDFGKPTLKTDTEHRLQIASSDYHYYKDTLVNLVVGDYLLDHSMFRFDISVGVPIAVVVVGKARSVQSKAINYMPKDNMLYGDYTYTAAAYNADLSQSNLMATSATIEVPMGSVLVDMSEITYDPNIPTDGGLILFRANTGAFGEVERWVHDDVPLEYLDSTHDAFLGLPPINIGGSPPPSGINYLTEHKGRLYGAVRNRVYFSEYGDPHNWSAVSYIIMPEEITALGSTYNGLLMFARSRIDVLIGVDLATYQTRLVSKTEGCVSFRSLQEAEGVVVFLSANALCSCDGTRVTNISEELLGDIFTFTHDFKLQDVSSSAYINKVYTIATNYFFLVMDLRRGVKFYSFSDNSYAREGYDSITASTGTIYGHRAGATYSLASSKALALLEYKSGDNTEGGVTNLKEYDKVRVTFTGVFEIIIYIDGKEVQRKDITAAYKDMTVIGIPKKHQRGLQITYSVAGVGVVYGFDYTVIGRANTP